MNTATDLHNEIRTILLDEDPGGVYIKELHNSDEYDLEIEKIIRLLEKENSKSYFINRVHALFFDLFGETKKAPKYKKIAEKIWEISRKT